MFAVIKTGGKQYRVAADDVITVGKLDGEAGASVELGEVLMMSGDNGVTVGAPAIEGAKVMAEIVRHERADKVIAFKKRRRQNSKRKRGHRQDHTVLRITAIGAEKASGEPKKRAASAKAKAKPAEAEAAEA